MNSTDETLGNLAQAGLTHITFLPVFDIASVMKNKNTLEKCG